MDPATLAVIGAIQVGGAIVGHFASEGERRAAQRAFDKAMAEIESLGLPPNTATPLMLQRFAEAGILTPKVEQEIKLGMPKLAQIQEDSRLKDAQMKALGALQERGALGFTPEERAEMMQQQRAAEREAGAQRAGIIEGLRSRGLMDSGVGLRAQLRSADEIAEQQSMLSQQRSSQASQRALESMRQAGLLGGQIRGQEFDIESQKARAEDEMNRFNVTAAMQRQQRQIDRDWQAQQLNEQARLQQANLSTSAYNQELARQAAAKERYWQNERDRIALRSGVATKESERQGAVAAGKAQAWGDVAGGVTKGIVAATDSGKDATKDVAVDATKKLATTPSISGKSIALPEIVEDKGLGVYDYTNQSSRAPDWWVPMTKGDIP